MWNPADISFDKKTKTLVRMPHKLPKVRSVKQEINLDLNQHPPHRRYFCHLCKQEVIICLDCDHCQKYCPVCKTIAKRNSNRLSNDKYRKTSKGRKTRAACESRRKKRLREKCVSSTSYKKVGDPSTNIAKVLRNSKIGTNGVPTQQNTDLEKGVDDDFDIQDQTNLGGTLGFWSERRNYKPILCAYCLRACSIYTYQRNVQKWIFKKKYSKIRQQFKNRRDKK